MFFADDHAHPGRPAGQVHQVRELGDPRAFADLLSGVIGRGPHVLGDECEQVRGVLWEREPDRVGQPPAGQGLDDLVGAAGAVDADQDRLATRGPRDLRESVGDDLQVVGGGVRPGVARAQQDRDRFTGACLLYTSPSPRDS